MKNITMIAAVGKNNELGKDNKLLWRFKEDMQFFKEQTMGKPIAMGMNTFNSLPKLLPGRTHIVLTSKNPELDPSVILVHSKEELLQKAEEYPELMIIGGAMVYHQMLEYSDKLILTEINDEKEADVYFPDFDKNEWDSIVVGENTEQDISYKHLVYTRKKR